jgi:hypothetical protein
LFDFSKKNVKHFFCIFFYFNVKSDVEEDFLITEMGVSNEATNVIPLKFLRKIKKKMFSSCELNPANSECHIFRLGCCLNPTLTNFV